ncbi:MAG: hypothetical protein ACK5S7_15585, partial [Dolichospermum sp.]
LISGRLETASTQAKPTCVNLVCVVAIYNRHNLIKHPLRGEGSRKTFLAGMGVYLYIRTYAKYLSNPHFSVTSVPGVVRYSMNLA